MGASIAYGIILEKENHDKILNKILTALPEHEQKLVYLDIYDDEFATYTELKRELAILNVETQEFKDEAFATLTDRDAIYHYIEEKYPLLGVWTLRSGERSFIVVGRSHRFLEEYGPIAQESFSTEELGQLSAANAELDLTPQWFYWRY